MEAHVKGIGLVRLSKGLGDWLGPKVHSLGQGLLQLLKIECLPKTGYEQALALIRGHGLLKKLICQLDIHELL